MEGNCAAPQLGWASSQYRNLVHQSYRVPSLCSCWWCTMSATISSQCRLWRLAIKSAGRREKVSHPTIKMGSSKDDFVFFKCLFESYKRSCQLTDGTDMTSEIRPLACCETDLRRDLHRYIALTLANARKCRSWSLGPLSRACTNLQIWIKPWLLVQPWNKKKTNGRSFIPLAMRVNVANWQVGDCLEGSWSGSSRGEKNKTQQLCYIPP